jgi:hypothetical protein
MARLADPKDKLTGSFPFEYVPSHQTDIRATFKRIRKQQLDSLKAPSPVRAINEKRRA